MPKLKILLPVLLLGLSLPVTAQQVYRSTDDQGNTTFSDQPMPESEEVVIEKPNVADPVAVPPPSAAPAPEPEPTLEAEAVPEGELVSEPKKSSNKKKRKKNKRKWKRWQDYQPVPHL